MSRLVLPIRNLKQHHRSANCGPCTLKMALDYYRVCRPNGRAYSLQSVNRLLRVDREFGCEKADFYRVARRLGLGYHRVAFTHLPAVLRRGHPVMVLYLDEDAMGHYALIVGFTATSFILNDPWHRNKIQWKRAELRERIRPYGDWLVRVSTSSRFRYPTAPHGDEIADGRLKRLARP